ncbi:MAG: XRE family transcriptional regulator [Proteobacteria bacterium]|nr:MAG: XRE family transcriptional regulator [Pseudomonadota bacterium]
MESLGDKIKSLRLATGVSLRQFSGTVGITPAFMSDIELGRRYPSDEVLEKIARALDVPFTELKSCDARESLTELKRMVQGDARWAMAFRTVAEQVKQSGLTPDELMKKLSS